MQQIILEARKINFLITRSISYYSKLESLTCVILHLYYELKTRLPKNCDWDRSPLNCKQLTAV